MNRGSRDTMADNGQQRHGLLQRLLLVTVISLFAVLHVSCEKGDQPEILWDKFGVPHIYGTTNQSLYYAFGWAQMNNHADLILELYAKARGQAAEFFGKDYINSDREMLLFDLPGLAHQGYLRQDPEFRSCLDAFVKGMNDYAVAHPEAVSARVKPVLPVKAEDVTAHIMRVIYLEFLASEDINSALDEMAPGSNSMAIAPSKSASGKAMLIANPHLPWGDFFMWFEAQLNGPDFSLYGVALVGMPVVTIGFNQYLGWTHTVNTIDASDRYELTLAGGGYLLDGSIKQFSTREVKIKVKQDDGSLKVESFTFRNSVHGPVISEKGTKALALRISGLDNTGMFEQYHRMAAASDLKTFEAALSMLQNPMFNVVYADKDGNILYVFNGDIPVRSRGDFAFWHAKVDGTSSDLVWTATHPYTDLPRVLNPPGGFLQNCNDPPWVCCWPTVLKKEDYPPYMAPVGTWWRAQRAVNMVKDDQSITFDELVAYKLNTEMEVANRFLGPLLDAVKLYPDPVADEAASVLRAWDRKADSSSRGAILFATWWDQLDGSIFEKQWSSENPVSTPSGLKDQKKAVDLLVKAAKSVKEKFGSPDVATGSVFRFRMDKYDFPGNGGADKYGVFRTMYYAPDPDGKWHAVAGDTFVAVAEFGDKVRADVLLSYGNASQPGSRHRGDQLQLLSEKKLRHALLDRKDILENLEGRELLTIR